MDPPPTAVTMARTRTPRRSNPFSTPFRAPVTAKTKVPSQTRASTIQKHHRPGLDVGRRQALRGLEGEADAVLGKAEEAG
ncbi:hypothetical protein TthAA37_19600 [Thermus thermophilus]|uniref:Uncharacterized protein n=1 Tax=Thermus thermophilus TaxID=274 RepID=A0AAD1KVT0_THETH|nr:hypothetical protein TthAA220_18750 [Thermus thermophilus]BBL85392.1 hypothetical protein TthAA229_18730 [Thermus thermophilus]BCZ87739.1 hypothetical protein TthAA11_19210 [Thermus thermophilus]BCZ90098.1 hypothetical protein TthAA22_19030 [Thermus thermophilus]BCZ92771.1 hypothetical protein TthAA37_19600 [Thermus thermophilus]